VDNFMGQMTQPTVS